MSNTIDPKDWDNFNRAYYRKQRVIQRIKAENQMTVAERQAALEKIRAIRNRLETNATTPNTATSIGPKTTIGETA